MCEYFNILIIFFFRNFLQQNKFFSQQKKDERFVSQFEAGVINQFKPFSNMPPVFKDLAFWIDDPDFEENEFFAVCFRFNLLIYTDFFQIFRMILDFHKS